MTSIGSTMQDSAAKMPGVAMREKYWTERDREEKLEALRDITIHLFAMCESIRDDLQRLLRHQHSANGQLMSPLEVDLVLPRNRRIPTSLDSPPESMPDRIGAIHGR